METSDYGNVSSWRNYQIKLTHYDETKKRAQYGEVTTANCGLARNNQPSKPAVDVIICLMARGSYSHICVLLNLLNEFGSNFSLC